MGERMRRFDWTASSVGPPEQWPQSLKTIVRVMLDSRYAMWMLWGPELTFFCNDAYLPTVGFKRAWVLGARADKVWEEIWPDIGPRIRQVLEHGESTWDEALLLFLERRGFLEETYHTFSYSPVYDDNARIAGMLCVVTEVTEKVLAERRLHSLRELGAASSSDRSATAQEACRITVTSLVRNARDIPWAAALLIEEEHARVLACAGADAAGLGLEDPLPLEGHVPSRWHLGEVMRTGRSVLIEGLDPLQFTAGPWEQWVTRACAVPVWAPGHDGIAAILIVGVSPRLAFDRAYQEFLEQCTLYLGQALTNARAYEEERRRAVALAELDRAKTRFFSNVSHEFRTPLTLMLGPIEDALKDPGAPVALKERLELAHRNSLRLLKLVNSLLDFSRLEAGRLQASFEPTDLATATRAIAGTFQSAVERAGLAYRMECAPLDELVFVDRDLWEKIVLNLISNAFKFTLEGSITVRLRREGDHALLEVIDTGVGIPEGDRAHIFERFYRIESTRGRTFEGSGIGLAFVQELVRMHGGTAGFQSAVGRGTTFFVRLPFGSHHLPVERVRTSVQHMEPPALAQAFVQEALRWLPEESRTEGAPGEVAEGGHVGPDRRFERTFGSHILIADDNADMRSYLRELLSGSYVLEMVGDGESALEAARSRTPDLILTDVMMPRLGGLGLLRAVRSDEGLRRVPVVLLSARAGEEAHIEGLDAGADDYLIKPFSARELLARLGALLELKQMREAGEQRLRIALAAARMVTWDWNLNSNRVQFSANAAEVLGADWTDRAYVRSIIHPDDWPGHQKAIRAAIRARGSLRSEVRLRRPDTGELRWYEVRGQVECDSMGEARTIHGATMDVTERKRVEEALRDMDRRKDEFLAMLAHELRNPLAPIQTGSELLERNFQADESIHGVAAMVKRQVAQLARLVDDLLDVSRITQGRIELKREPIELSDIVERSLETLMPVLQEKEHRLENIPSLTPLFVRGDVTRLVQALANLLANAAKYTDRGGQIRVEVRRDRGFGIIEVRDNGMGISGDLLGRVFELFVQGDRTLDRSQGGLGIGLSVVKRLIEMHGGTVSAASAGEKQGSSFTVRLPLIAEPVGREQPGAAQATAAVPVEPRRVLVIDDNVDAADTLCMLLKVSGHAAEAVYGARDALERLVEFNAEAALVDIGLPDMNGYDLARQIRARSGRIQLIALTGYGQQEDFVRSREAGFDAHMIKPVEIDAVEAVLARGRPLN
jgi:PAS domain S-box-containing protein